MALMSLTKSILKIINQSVLPSERLYFLDYPKSKNNVCLCYIWAGCQTSLGIVKNQMVSGDYYFDLGKMVLHKAGHLNEEICIHECIIHTQNGRLKHLWHTIS